MEHRLDDWLLPGTQISRKGAHYQFPMPEPSEAIKANAHYFSNPQWAQEYLDYCHRSEHFRQRWLAAGGDWTGKVVVDLGCGPGNVFATLGGKPAFLIGVDVAEGSLELAARNGYVALRADAAQVPLKSDFADIVAINASIHHCEDMRAVLREGARILKPGGALVTDHDPQLSAWDFKGLAKFMWDARLVIYRLIGHGFHKTGFQQACGLRTEIHHRPGDGVTEALFRETLEPLGFDVQVYRHNHEIGAEALQGQWGRAEFKYRVGNFLSGRDPKAAESALSLMCVAHKRKVAVA
ncbi:ubiquinone/menaquinone biosynthesis methyltransferase [Variovorax sp. PBL-H6]|uniref:class I SAM-dependent methyltransferase n=1 Tax=Variovorax sp. PBL-H6 TaxID=434009 RepID=UPI001318B1C3|nr:class I SAM-dependent methyltransferase [Variovorax sp. PBL-H6]VTU21332.1 ubiquinone/menaquinone biosynthesis methyltransferase [Variovorax sp. PBL-H6]